MDKEVFDECLQRWEKSDGYTPFWNELAEKFGYSNGESLRYSFKKAKKKLGIKKELKKLSTTAKILLFDVETSPIRAFVWGIWEQNINANAIIDDWFLFA